MENILEVQNVEKYYGNKSNLTKAVDNISFNVKKKEFVGIMGASGSGKTTLLNCISTIDKVTTGHILINGDDITKLKGNKLNKFRREELGFIFQDFNLLDTLKCGELLLVAIRYYGDTLPYTMHAIYVKDNWCFDTYTQRQFPLTRFFELYEAKFYKEISYSEIEHLTYEEFILTEAKLMKEWCKENKCSTTFG